MITLEEVKQYAKIEYDEDDGLLRTMIAAAEEYLKNATGKEYREEDEAGNKIDYTLEKLYLQLLISYWYEQRSPVLSKAGGFAVGEEFSYSTRSIMQQLKYR